MNLSSELEACLNEFAQAGPAELRENGARVAPLSSLSWEIRGQQEKPLLHMWSENHNLTRRVIAITDQSEKRLALAVECFGRTKPDRWEFLRTDFERSDRDLSRERFARSIAAYCSYEFPDYKLESLSTSPDLEHSLSGNYVRGALRRGSQSWALLAVPDHDGSQDAARCITFALLWLDRLRQKSTRKQVVGVKMILPADALPPIAHFLPALRPDLQFELFERDTVMERLRKVDPASVGNFTSRIVPLRETQSLLDRASQELYSILPAIDNAITFHPNLAGREVIVRFRGLACVRWHESGIHFGVLDAKKKWDPGKARDLAELFQKLELHRHPSASDTRNPFFRPQAERWLEFTVSQDLSRINRLLDERFCYAQVTASTAGEHGILDILTVTRSGRLAILELKTVEQPVFLLQAANYWLRINRHLQQGDFARLGYFSTILLQSRPPIVYLVAPALQFHAATEILLRYINPEMEVVRLGLTESWRQGLSVVLRQ